MEVDRGEAERAIERDGYTFKITPVALPDDLVRRNGEGKVAQRGVPRNDYELAERLSSIYRNGKGGMKMSISKEELKEKARAHWKKHRPEMFKGLQESGELE